MPTNPYPHLAAIHGAYQPSQRRREFSLSYEFDYEQTRLDGRDLLVSQLTPEQQHTYRTWCFVDVISNYDRRWRITTNNLIGNVTLMTRDGGRELACFCGMQHATRAVSPYHHWLAQMLVLRHDEDHFVNNANVTGVAPGADPREIPHRLRASHRLRGVASDYVRFAMPVFDPGPHAPFITGRVT